jgi:hypothetical protein
MMTTKYRDILILCISLVLIIAGTFLWLIPRVPFITQSIDSIERIVVVAQPNVPGSERTIYITEQIEIEYIYSLLNGTTLIRAHERPGYPGMQHSPRFFILLEYRNGEVEAFLPTEMGIRIFRFLDTRASDGTRGFIIGTNARLLEHIDNLIDSLDNY